MDLSSAVWCVMPILANWPLTCAAIADLLAQSVPTRLLLVNQGADDALRKELEALAEAEPERVLVWSHDPPLPSLAATWNRALAFVWACGGEEALVVNNDTRTAPKTVAILRQVLEREDALLVSAVGVTAEQYAAADFTHVDTAPFADRGGPDFSCFLISRAGHAAYPFDEALTPAFLEDLDLHRRLMLAGHGARIFSINLPFHHVGGGSQTLKTVDPAQRTKLEQAIQQGSRAHYAKKWGGPANAERYTIPFDAASARDGVTTPELQAALRQEASHVG